MFLPHPVVTDVALFFVLYFLFFANTDEKMYHGSKYYSKYHCLSFTKDCCNIDVDIRNNLR